VSFRQSFVFGLPKNTMVGTARLKNTPSPIFCQTGFSLRTDALVYALQQCLKSSDLPMLGNVAEPGDAGGFEGDVGVEAAGDGLVDDGLLLLPQQRNHPPLVPDETVDRTLCLSKCPAYCHLLFTVWGHGHRQAAQSRL